MENSIHLGDGAYATFTGYSYILTANHADPMQATDVVHLDERALENLIALKRRCEEARVEDESHRHAEPGCS